MEKLCIRGGVPLRGTMLVSGSKNATLPILAASLLVPGPLVLRRVPHLNDVTTMLELLGRMGVWVALDEDMSVTLDASAVHKCEATYGLVKTMRASILVLGPLLARFGQARVSLPGGCAIGPRPVNLHIDAMRALGATIDLSQGYICASVEGRLKGTEFSFETVTVTGTENVMMAACLAEGTTVLRNVACEPEVVDLAHCLNTLGARIEGAGTSTMVIHGVSELHGGSYEILPDRIEACTYLIGAAMTRGDLKLEQVDPALLAPIPQLLEAAGVQVTQTSNSIHINASARRPKSISFETAPYPGVATDLQGQLMAFNAVADGEAHIHETIFENRFMHAQEMLRMGANIVVRGNEAIVTGVEKLHAAPVMATDLRASASLILAALVAEGETIVDRIYHVDRGYERIEEKLSALGAHIYRLGA